MSDTDRAEQISARLAAATPGPWATDEQRPRWIETAAPIEIDEADWGREGHTSYRLATNADDSAWKYADVTLIANAPADLAWLLDALAAEQAKVARVEEVRHKMGLAAEAWLQKNASTAERLQTFSDNFATALAGQPEAVS